MQRKTTSDAKPMSPYQFAVTAEPRQVALILGASTPNVADIDHLPVIPFETNTITVIDRFLPNDAAQSGQIFSSPITRFSSIIR